MPYINECKRVLKLKKNTLDKIKNQCKLLLLNNLRKGTKNENYVYKAISYKEIC